LTGKLERMSSSRQAALLSCLALFCLLACAQDLPQNSDPKKTYPLRGTVVNSVTGKPVSRVLVHLENRAILTGPRGDFEFADVPAGKARILLNKPGYFFNGRGRINRSPSIAYESPYSVEVGPDVPTVLLKLVPEAVVSGTILGEDEEPLEGVRVNVLAYQTVEGRRQLFPVHRGRSSDEDGNFKIAGLAPGRYYLSLQTGQLSRTILGARSESTKESYPVSVYFPSAENVAEATPLDLAAGQHEEANFVLKMVPSFKVAGAVTNLGGWKQVQAPELTDEFEQRLLSSDRFNQESGAFEFRAVPAGSYWLRMWAVSQDGRNLPVYRRLIVQSTLTDLRIPLQPGLDIPIQLRTDYVHQNSARGQCTSTDSDSGEVHRSDCLDYPAVRLELNSLDFGQLRFQSDFRPIQGDFCVRGVRPGRYKVRATPTFGGYVQSVRAGGIDLTREPLVVPEDGSVGAIEVVVRDDPGTLSIQIRSEKPGQEAVVLVFPDPMMIAEAEMTAYSTAGITSAVRLAPGAYKIFAFDAGQDLDYSDIDILTKYLSQAASVTVGAEENANVAVDVIHVGE
jgi:hypothetical protein